MENIVVSSTAGVISLEKSNASLLLRWKPVPLHEVKPYNVLKSKKFTYNNENWHFLLRLFSSTPTSVFGRIGNNLQLCLVGEHNMESFAAFKDRNGVLVSRAEMKVGTNTYTAEEKNNSIVFNNSSFWNGVQGEIFVEFSIHEKCSTAESSHLTGDRYVELYHCLKDSYLKKLHCDFTVTVKNRSFQVHKMILAARSTVFAAMMNNEMAEKRNNSVNITDCDPEAFHVFLLYLYSAEIGELSTENVTDVYVIADKYGVGNLKEDCVEHMKKNLTFDRFCDIFELAAKYNELELLRTSKAFFVKNSRKIVSTDNFQLMMKENTALANELILLLTPEN